jgi:hypothetical protein
MKRRRIFWTGVGLVSVLAMLVTPRTIETITAILKNEHFYRGRPTSYWRNKAKSARLEREEWIVHGPSMLGQEEAPLGRLEGWVEDRLESPPVGPGHNYVLYFLGDPAAMPVLKDLLADEDPEVRAFAAHGLALIGIAAKDVVPSLLECLEDKNPEVRGAAAEALRRIEPELANKMGVP